MDGTIDGDTIEKEEAVEARSFPPAFYCPLSAEILRDPVVVADGISYERETLSKCQSQKSVGITKDCNFQNYGNKCYPNRSLKAIIEEECVLRGKSFEAALKRIQESAEAVISRWWTIEGEEALHGHRPLNDGYFCPITFAVLYDPVIDPEGYTYEKVAVHNWIRLHQTSPVTRSKLSIEELVPNTTLLNLIQFEANMPEQEMHPTIRKWKDEMPPEVSDVELGGKTIGRQRQPEDTLMDTAAIVERRRYREQAIRRRSVLHSFGIFTCCLCVVGLLVFGRSVFLLIMMMTLILVFAKRRPP